MQNELFTEDQALRVGAVIGSANSKLNQIWFDVHSELYGITTACVLDIENDLKRGWVPCGSGEDYQFTQHEIEQLEIGIEKESDFMPSSKLDYPKNLVALLRPEGNIMLLPKHFRFDKKQYADVKNIIQTSGGTYSKNTFQFDESAIDVYRRILHSDEFNQKKAFQFFATPDLVCDRLVELAEIEVQHDILEPSAGRGAIVNAIHRELGGTGFTVWGYELMPINVPFLEKISGFRLLGSDFLTECDTSFDRIIANPPFSKNQDINHVMKMYNQLKKGGRIVSIVGTSWKNGSQKKQVEFRKWLDDIGAKTEKIEKDAFKESGTSIETTILIIDKF